MKQRVYGTGAGLCAALVFCLVSGCRTVGGDAERPVLDDGGEETFLFARLRNIPESPAAQLRRAEALDEAGRVRRARRNYRLLVSRWPASAEAAQAQRRFAALLHAQGREEAAFDAYRTLLERYPHEVPYEEIMERKYRIAQEVKKRRRMRFLFGGYRAPESALPLFETIVELAPGSEWAVQAQLNVGRILEEKRDYNKAAEAYSRLLQLFPDSPYAVDAVVRRAVSLCEDSRRHRNDVRRMNEAAFALEHALQRVEDAEVEAELTDRLAQVQERRARQRFDQALYYEKSERNPDAAAIGYRALLRDFPDIEPWSEKARRRLETIETAASGAADGE